MTGEFEKRVKELKLDPKFEETIINMFNEAASEDPCMKCCSKEGCDNFKWHKKYLNTDTDKCGCNCGP